MPAHGISRADKIRAERRESLRELLRQQGHEQYVLELLSKLEDLGGVEMDSVSVQRLGKAIDTRMKLIAKYLPDDREPQDINLGGQEDNPIKSEAVINFVGVPVDGN
jgi:hypothetical protein